MAGHRSPKDVKAVRPKYKNALNAKEDFLPGGGGMGDLVRSMDWSITPIGSRDTWPESLHTVVNLILASSFPMAILWGSDLILIYNDAYGITTREKHPDALGRSAMQVWPEVWGFNKSIFDRVMAGGETVHFDEQLFPIVSNGRVENSYFTLSYSPIHSYKNHVAGILVVLLENTQRKKAEEEQKHLAEKFDEQRARLQAIIDSLPVGLWIADADGKMLLINDIARSIWGGKTPYATAIKGYGEYKAWWADTGEPILADDMPLARALRGGISKENVINIERFDGTSGTQLVSASPVKSREGRIIGSVAVVQDITMRKQMENDLRQSRDQLDLRIQERTVELEHAYDALRQSEREKALILDNTSEIIGYHDRNQCIQWANNAYLKAVGMTLAEIQGKKCYQAWGLDRRCFDCPAARVLEHGGPESGELTPQNQPDWPSNQGSWLVRAAPVKDEDGNITGVIEVAYDITERKQLEHQLNQAQKMEALGTLAGGIAHDFNNLLGAVIGFTELIQDDLPEGSPGHGHAARVMEAGLRGRDLVNQMLTFSYKTEHKKVPSQISTIVKESAKLLRASIPTTIAMNVTIKNEEALILADPVQVQQVVMNLCTNAYHAMLEKGGTLTIELSDINVDSTKADSSIVPGPYMRLTVRDTGTGIPVEIRDKIFDPFFTTKCVGEGTGLGLSVVIGIVRQSGGYITVESEPGKGSAFSAYFPKIMGELAADLKGKKDPLFTGTERILFVDDEELLQKVGEQLLTKLGYKVTVQMSSEAALSLIEKNPSGFDLVITDQTMPDMTGVELAKKILAIRPDMPVILCTGFSHLVDAESANAAGIRRFAKKPLTKRELAKTVREVLDGKNAA